MKEKKPNLFIFGLVVLLIIAAFAIGVLWQRLSSLEKGGKEGEEPAKHPLERENLLKYAQELGLDKNKFAQCLDKDKYKEAVEKDKKQAAELGVRGTPGFFINGKFLGGAFPFEYFQEIIDKELSGKSSVNVKDYSQKLQQAASEGAFNPKPKKIEISSNDPLLGAAEAPLTLVEFSDFQCPFCGQVYPTVKRILKEYEGKIKFVYKQLPLVAIHQYAQKAAEASLCAQEQGKFWPYHDKLFEVQKE